MPALVVPNAAMVTCRGVHIGQPWANVWGVQIGLGPLAQQTAEDIAVRFAEFYQASQSDRSDLWSHEDTTVRDLNAETAPQYEFAGVAEGTADGDDLSPATALVISLITPLRGRSYRGRSYQNGWKEAVNNSTGRPTNSIISNVASDFQDLIDNLGTDGTQLGVISRTLGQINAVNNFRIRQRWGGISDRNFPYQ